MSNGFSIPSGQQGGQQGGNTAYYAPGGPGYVPYAPAEPSAPVYSGTEPTVYATDTPALVPLAPVPESNPQMPSYSWQDPLDLEGLKFPESTPSTPALGEQYGSYGGQPPSLSQPFESYGEVKIPPSGPVEWIVDAAGNVIEFGKSVVEFIGEHLDVGISYQYPGQTRPSQFPSVVLAGKEGSPMAPMIFTIPGGLPSSKNGGAPAAPAYAPMSEDERLLYEAQQQGQSDLGRFLMYGGLAFLAYKLLGKKA